MCAESKKHGNPSQKLKCSGQEWVSWQSAWGCARYYGAQCRATTPGPTNVFRTGVDELAVGLGLRTLLWRSMPRNNTWS